MKGHPPISDSGLLLGSIFVAVSIVGIGILGNQQGTVQMATANPTAMSAAAGATTPAAAPAKQECLPKNESNQASVDTPCVDGCQYVVHGGSFPAKATVTATTQYSDGSKNPGTVRFEAAGASSFTSLTCKGGSASTLGDAQGAGAAGANGLRGLVGSGANSMNVVPPASTAAQVGTAAGGTSAPLAQPGATPASGAGTSDTGASAPTQQGCYPIAGGGTTCYTPASGNTPAQYQTFGPVGGSDVPGPGEVESDPVYAQYMQDGDIDKALAAYDQEDAQNNANLGPWATQQDLQAAGGGSVAAPTAGAVAPGAANSTNGFEGYTVGQLQQAQYAGQGNGFNGDTAAELQAAQNSVPAPSTVGSAIGPAAITVTPPGAPVLSGAPPNLPPPPNPSDFANTTDYYNAEVSYYDYIMNKGALVVFP